MALHYDDHIGQGGDDPVPSREHPWPGHSAERSLGQHRTNCCHSVPERSVLRRIGDVEPSTHHGNWRRSIAAGSQCTGVGGGIVLNGQLLDGATGNAGHIGHIVVEPNGRRCSCGARGCLEAEASGRAIEAITGRPPTEPSYEIMQRTGDLVGRAVASVCNVLDLDLVVVGGSVALGFGATFFNSAQAALDRHAQLDFSRGARVTPARLEDRGPLIGAGAVGMRGLRRSARRTAQ